MLEELVYFGRAEDYRKFVRNTASRKSAFRPGRLQSDVVQEFSGHHEVVDRLGRILAFIDHILGSGVKTRLQDRRGFNLVALASIVSARLSIIGEGLSLSTGRFCGRVSSPGMRNSL